MDHITSVLKKIGLTDNEIKIYLSSLSIGQSSASILGQKVGIPRSTARYACQSLVSKKIMSMVPKKDYFLFTAEQPDKLLSLLDREYGKIDEKVRELQSIMGLLKQNNSQSLGIPNVKYYQGASGIIEILEDVFTEKEIIYGLLNYVDDMHPDVYKYIKESYIPKRIKTGIKSNFLFSDTNITTNYRSKDKEMNRITLIAPKELFPFDIGIHIYGNKVALYSYSKKDLTGIIIENELIKTAIFSMFKMAWNYAKTLPINNINSQD